MCACDRNRQLQIEWVSERRAAVGWLLFLRFNSFEAMLQPFYRSLFLFKCSLCVHWNSIWLSLKYHFTLFGVTVLLNDQTKHQIYSPTLIAGWYVLDSFRFISFYTVFSIHRSLFDVWAVSPYISYVSSPSSLAHTHTHTWTLCLSLLLFLGLDGY